jgi:thymidylate synthase
MNQRQNANIPVLAASGFSIADSWERSLVALHSQGCDIKTQYDKPGDPPSKDCTMIISVANPLSEPMIHLDFPGGPEDLQEYVMEVTEGIKDHLIRDPNDPDDTRWEYTYHQRLFKYDVNGEVFDQIEAMSQKLAKSPHTRRAQAITWKVDEDNDCYDPACLQSLWGRIIEDQGIWFLNMNVRFRSNDAYKAAFMNIFALIMLQKKIAGRISEITGREVFLGRYVHVADSYHLYGSYFKEFEDRFIKNFNERSFENRTAQYEDWKEIMEEAKPKIEQKIKGMQ